NPIALVIQLWMARTGLVDEIRDALHLFLAFCGEAFKAFGVIEQTRFRLIRGEIHEFSQDGPSRRKQIDMIAGASVVPIAERFPFLAVLCRTKNVALSRQDKIR